MSALLIQNILSTNPKVEVREKPPKQYPGPTVLLKQISETEIGPSPHIQTTDPRISQITNLTMSPVKQVIYPQITSLSPKISFPEFKPVSDELNSFSPNIPSQGNVVIPTRMMSVVSPIQTFPNMNIGHPCVPLKTREAYIAELKKVLYKNDPSLNSQKNSVFSVRQDRHNPPFDDSIFPKDESAKIFSELYNDKTNVINPRKLKFIPTNFWPDKDIPFCDIVDDFFRRKNHISCRFPHKLYNAFQLNQLGPKYQKISGVQWLNIIVLKVDKNCFSRLLGISSIEGSLFHRQGNFTTHGFVEMPFEEMAAIFGLEHAKELVQNSDMRYLKHNLGIFRQGVTEEDIERCKWVSSKKRHNRYY